MYTYICIYVYIYIYIYIVKFWGIQIFKGDHNILRFINIRHDILIQTQGNYIEMKRSQLYAGD